MGENPISIHVLGICSALAITTKIDTAVVMTIANYYRSGFKSLHV